MINHSSKCCVFTFLFEKQVKSSFSRSRCIFIAIRTQYLETLELSMSWRFLLFRSSYRCPESYQLTSHTLLMLHHKNNEVVILHALDHDDLKGTGQPNSFNGLPQSVRGKEPDIVIFRNFHNVNGSNHLLQWLDPHVLLRPYLICYHVKAQNPVP